jgi:hypothetical protein
MSSPGQSAVKLDPWPWQPPLGTSKGSTATLASLTLLCDTCGDARDRSAVVAMLRPPGGVGSRRGHARWLAFCVRRRAGLGCVPWWRFRLAVRIATTYGGPLPPMLDACRALLTVPCERPAPQIAPTTKTVLPRPPARPRSPRPHPQPRGEPQPARRGTHATGAPLSLECPRCGFAGCVCVPAPLQYPREPVPEPLGTTGNHTSPLQCPACRSRLALGASSCPTCGWYPSP